MDVTIVEVSPRDGLQNEKAILSTAQKLELIERLIDAGLTRIEALSFASPKSVPTMADAEVLANLLPRGGSVRYAGLVLNPKGLDRALKVELDEINVVVCATDTFSSRNQGVSTEVAMENARSIISTSRSHKRFTTLTLAVAFGCPFEGEVNPERVVDLALTAASDGVDEICIADTIGVGVPSDVRSFIKLLQGELLSTGTSLRFHFHNTRNTGIANALVAIEEGVKSIDASAGGIGGCPFAPKATGNIATDDLTYMLERMGVDTGIQLSKLVPVAGYLSNLLGHEVPALLPRAGLFPH